jgi:hypothetical protein
LRGEKKIRPSEFLEEESGYTSVGPNCNSSVCSGIGIGVDYLFYMDPIFSSYYEMYSIKESSIPEPLSC